MAVDVAALPYVDVDALVDVDTRLSWDVDKAIWCHHHRLRPSDKALRRKPKESLRHTRLPRDVAVGVVVVVEEHLHRHRLT